MAYDAVMEDCHISGAATNIDHCHSGIAVTVVKDSLGRSNRLQHNDIYL